MLNSKIIKQKSQEFYEYVDRLENGLDKIYIMVHDLKICCESDRNALATIEEIKEILESL